MQVSEILAEDAPQELQLIRERCSRFLRESGAYPLYKNLPRSYPDFHRVKVRHRRVDILGEAMNIAFKNEDKRMAQRAIWASGSNHEPRHERLQEYLEPFYVFPIDGYRFIYNKEIRETLNIADLNPIIEQMGENEGIQMIADVLKFSYTSNHLAEGLENGSEIILYGIPYYYVLRESVVTNYEDLLTEIINI